MIDPVQDKIDEARARRRAEIGFAWVRLVLGIVVGTILAVVIAGYQSRDNSIAACIRNGDSKIIDAHFYESAAEKNREVAENTANVKLKDANNTAAAEYDKDAIDKRATIPMPNGWKGNPKTRGESPEIRKLGCDDAFPPPIPFVE